jgi:hypothetical protein
MDDTDLMTQAADLQRRRRVQEAMLARAEASSNRAASGDGDILDALLGWKTRRSAEASGGELTQLEQAHRQRYNQQLAKESESYLDLAQGRPGEVMTTDQADALLNRDENIQLQDEVKANPRQAVIRAMTSQLPEMQNLGKTAFSQLGKQEKPEFVQGHDGTLIELPATRGGTPRVAGNYGKPEKVEKADSFGPLEVVGRDAKGNPIQGQKNLKTGKFEYAPGGAGQTIHVNATTAAQKQGLNEWSKIAAETVKDLTATARSSVKMLGQLAQVEKLSDSGTFNGPTANGAIWLGQLAKAAGVPVSADTSARLQNSETFGNTAADLWLQSMNANGGSRGLVKEESERIAANLPALLQTPQGRKQIVAVMRQAAQQNIEDAQRSNIEYANALQTQDPSKFTFGMINTTLPNTMPMEPAPGSAAGKDNGGVTNWKDYLKR